MGKAPVQLKPCPNCGFPISRDARICSHCADRLRVIRLRIALVVVGIAMLLSWLLLWVLFSLLIAVVWEEAKMSNVIPLLRSRASKETIDWLITQGYLKAEKRNIAGAVHEALARLRNDMYREAWDPPIIA